MRKSQTFAACRFTMTSLETNGEASNQPRAIRGNGRDYGITLFRSNKNVRRNFIELTAGTAGA
jgi:hypothetical protein